MGQPSQRRGRTRSWLSSLVSSLARRSSRRSPSSAQHRRRVRRRSQVLAALCADGLALALAALGVSSRRPLLTLAAGTAALVAALALFITARHRRAADAEGGLQRVAVSRLMERFAATIPHDALLAEAARRCLSLARSGLLVEEDGSIVGRISAARVLAVPYAYQTEVDVASMMEPVPAPLSPHDPVSEACRRMRELSIDELPVVEEGCLTGVLRLDRVEQWVAGARAAREQGAPGRTGER